MLKEVAFKTGGLCADCFRRNANRVINGAIVVVSGRERVVLRSRRSPAELAGRKRTKQRARAKPENRAKINASAKAHATATSRLRRLFPELFEVLLADERAKAGLNAWTIDRAITPGTASKTLEFLASYYRLEEAS